MEAQGQAAKGIENAEMRGFAECDIVTLRIREGATLVQTVDDVMEALRPIDPRMLGEPGVGSYGTPRLAADVGDADRRAVTELLGPVPTPIDEIIRQSALPPAIVQTVLLELELAGRLERHAGGQVSLA